MKTMTVGELIAKLQEHPPHVPVFVYDFDKERDLAIEVVELAGPHLEPDECGIISDMSPYYCKGYSRIEEHWGREGKQPIICLREKTYIEQKKGE